MILEEETFMGYGYYPHELARKSHKPILAACDDCGKVRIISKNGYHPFCKSCSCKGERNHRFGIHPTEETLKKRRRALKNPSKETRQKLREASKGRHHTEASKEKMRASKIGEKNPNYGKVMSEKEKEHLSEISKNPSEDRRTKISEASKERWKNPEFHDKVCKILKKLWKDPKHIEKVIKGRNTKPNKLEKRVDFILQKYFLGDWKYNGDFGCGVTIGGMIPDFVNINGKKEVIEVFGDVWHDPKKAFDGKSITWKRTEFGRKATYSQFGFKCLVLWESQIDNLTDKEIAKIIGGFS